MTILLYLINFLSALLQSSIGFGYAMLGMSLFSNFIPITTAGTIIAFGSICIGIQMVITLRKEVEWTIVTPIIISCCLSTTIGIYALNHLDNNLLKIILALTILAFSGFFLYTQKKMIAIKPSILNSVFFGCLAGLGTGMFSMAGPFFLVYFYSTSKSTLSHKANMEICFLCSGLFNLFLRFLNHNIDTTSLTFIITSIPILILANCIGLHFYKKLPKDKLKTIICILLPFIAFYLLLT